MKVYVIVSLDGGIPYVEAVHTDLNDSLNYFDELLTHWDGEWVHSDNPQCIKYAVNEDLNEVDLRIYERNLL